MNPPEHFGYRPAAFHGIDHARGRGCVGAARTARADKCIRVKQQRQPIEIEGKGQLRERRTVFQRRPSLTQVVRRHGPQERHLQQQVDDRTQGDGAENRERYAASRMARLAGQVHRILETVVAEYDAAGRDGCENGGKIAHVPAAMHTDLKILRMKACAHQGDCRGRGHDEFEEGDGAVGIRKNLHAPEVHEEIDNDQYRGDPQSRMAQFSLPIGGVHVQGMRPVPGPGTHVLHGGLSLHRDHGNDGDPRRPAGHETDQRTVRVVPIAHSSAGLRKHGAELGVGECDEHNDHGTDDPGIDRTGARQLSRAPRTKQPA